MARPKRGIIYNLEKVLEQLLETNAALNKRLSQMEALLMGAPAAGRRGRKPGRKRGRKPGRRGRKPGAKKPCSVAGCKRPHYAKGLCASHYQQKRLKALKKKETPKA